jgi:hypothetical protein
MLSVTVLGGCGKPAAAAPPPAQTPVVEEPVEEPVAEPVMKEPIDPFGEGTKLGFKYETEDMSSVIVLHISPGVAGQGESQPFLLYGYRKIQGFSADDLIIPVTVSQSNYSDRACINTGFVLNDVLAENQELYLFNDENKEYELLAGYSDFLSYDQDVMFTWDLVFVWKGYYSEEETPSADGAPSITVMAYTSPGENTSGWFIGGVVLTVEGETFAYTTIEKSTGTYSEPTIF